MAVRERFGGRLHPPSRLDGRRVRRLTGVDEVDIDDPVLPPNRGRYQTDRVNKRLIRASLPPTDADTGVRENLDKGQKSEGSRRNSRCRWNILTPATQNFSGGNILTAATRSQPAALFHFGG